MFSLPPVVLGVCIYIYICVCVCVCISIRLKFGHVYSPGDPCLKSRVLTKVCTRAILNLGEVWPALRQADKPPVLPKWSGTFVKRQERPTGVGSFLPEDNVQSRPEPQIQDDALFNKQVWNARCGGAGAGFQVSKCMRRFRPKEGGRLIRPRGRRAKWSAMIDPLGK